MASAEELCAIINPADCDLGSALFHQEFAYVWSGARGLIGITGGKYCFGCEVLFNQPVKMEDTPLDQQHVTRVGISRGDTPVGSLGETEHSFGYNGNEKFLHAGRIVEYGETFGEGDVIVCSINLERKPHAVVQFSKNGKRLGPKGIEVTDSPAGKQPSDSAFFPHVLLKNTVVKFQFSTKQGLVPEEGYKPWDLAMKDRKAVLGPVFSDPKDSEVIMMVGLPGSGKTTWAEKWVKAHPEKRYILLGTDLALDKMKVPGSLRKFNNDGWYDCLMVRATDIVITLSSLAAKVSRNYIIDDCNVFKDSRRDKLKPFAPFYKIAVMVFPRLVELLVRGEKRSKEIGKEITFEDIYMKSAIFHFPMSKAMPNADEDFDEVIFTDLTKTEAQNHLGEMRRELLLSFSIKPPYPHDGSVYSDLGTGGSWVGQSEPTFQTNFANVNIGYTGAVRADALNLMQPFPNIGNVEYTGVGQPDASGLLPPISNNVNIGYPWAQQFATLDLMQSYPYNVNIGYTGVGQPNALEFMQPYSYNVNTGDIGVGQCNALESMQPFSSNYGSYVHDSYGTHEATCSYGPPAGFANYAQDTRSNYQPPNVSQHGTPNPMPQRSYPADGQYHGTAPYHPPTS